ncbi:MAG TPA: prolipoprotein diacylglyceryl transferase [Vicinamibacterales bacterium]|jgi:phosphatidylglycerol:prolipoprotein diacylglycerol transferase|nr:prolipoprotein diacylglyceryl transferase [Vicinamibacterales bacterium]
MLPVLFRIGSLEITSFGAMVALGALVGLWVFRRELSRAGLPDAALDAAVYGLVGGLLGAKLLYVFEHLEDGSFLSLFLDRGGMSWFGGFVGGLLAGFLTIRVKRWPLVPILAAAAPALAIGQMIGRIGCFLVGDDYGRPTSLPWGVAFPRGLPPTIDRVHPTQIYEAIFLAVLAWVLIRWRRKGVSDRVVLGRYLLLAGAFRFALEFVRVNTRVLGPLTVAHLFSLLVAALGGVLLLRPKPS